MLINVREGIFVIREFAKCRRNWITERI